MNENLEVMENVIVEETVTEEPCVEDECNFVEKVVLGVGTIVAGAVVYKIVKSNKVQNAKNKVKDKVKKIFKKGSSEAVYSGDGTIEDVYEE